MKNTYSDFLPAICTQVVILTCENCHRRFIIMDDSGDDTWAYLAQADFCPRCGHGHKTDYAGRPLKEG